MRGGGGRSREYKAQLPLRKLELSETNLLNVDVIKKQLGFCLSLFIWTIQQGRHFPFPAGSPAHPTPLPVGLWVWSSQNLPST